MQEIMQSATGVYIILGPMVSTDGIARTEAVDLATADFARIIKYGNTSASFSITSATLVNYGSGWYGLNATSSMFDTLGPAKVVIEDTSIMLPFWEDIAVVHDNYWNAKYGVLPFVASVSGGALASVSVVGTVASVSIVAGFGTGAVTASAFAAGAVATAGEVASVTWDTTCTGHVVTTSYGLRLGGAPTATTMASDIIAIMGAVGGNPWDTTVTGHTVTNSYGLLLGGIPSATTLASDINGIAGKTSYLPSITMGSWSISMVASVSGSVFDAATKINTYYPSVTAGSSGGVMLAGTNAQTTVNLVSSITGNLTGSITGNLTGSITGNLTGTLSSVSGSVYDAATKINTYYPSVSAGSAGGVFIAGTNALTTVNLTSSITGNQTGSITGNLTGSITGNLTGNVTGNLTGNIVGIVGDVSSSALDAIWDEVVDGTTVTARDSFKLVNSFVAGKASGGGTASITMRDLDDGLDRIILTVDASGNRASCTIDI